MQKQLTTNPSFTPRVVCPPFVQNTLNYPLKKSSTNYKPYGVPVLSPIQQMYPLHQTVLLNPYLPQMPLLKQYPTIEEEIIDTKKFSSLNTRNVKTKPKFQSMRIVRKRNIERFYPNTEYGENFNEINNNSKNTTDSDEVVDSEDNIYENFPTLLKIKSNVSGVEHFENLTDSIQVYEESMEDMNASKTSLNRPVPAPRTKITPLNSPSKSDHVYVNLSMPLISSRCSASVDVVDAPIRSSKSEENISKQKTHETKNVQAVPKRTTSLKNVTDINIDDNDDEKDNDINEEKSTKPNIIGITPKRTSITLPSTSLVRSVVNQLNDQGINKVSLPRKQIILPNKTLQIPKLTEKPIPKRNLVQRSNSVQISLPKNSEIAQV